MFVFKVDGVYVWPVALVIVVKINPSDEICHSYVIKGPTEPPVTDKAPGESPVQISIKAGLMRPPSKGGEILISIVLLKLSHSSTPIVLIALLL